VEANTKEAAKPDPKPASLGGRIITFVVGAGLLALAYWMFTHYTALDGTSYTGGSLRNRFWYWVICLVWSRPTAVVVGLLGLLVCFGAFAKDLRATDAPKANLPV
jgi:hypothetical protein